MRTRGKIVFYFFYSGLLYQTLPQWRESYHVFHTVIETRLLENQSSQFQNVILYKHIYKITKYVLFHKAQMDAFA